jgi:hypothetical protein
MDGTVSKRQCASRLVETCCTSLLTWSAPKATTATSKLIEPSTTKERTEQVFRRDLGLMEPRMTAAEPSRCHARSTTSTTATSTRRVLMGI